MKSLSYILIALLVASAGAARSQETNSDAGPNLKSFEMLWQKNIFNQSRTGIQRGDRPRVPRTERLILQGIGGDSSEAEAFFGGIGSADRGLKVGDHVGGFQLTWITPECVKLTNGASIFVLDMDKRRSLRRVDDGPWEGSADQAEPVTIATNTADETAASAPAGADASHPGESAIERKLRLRREQEEK
jgi:hypothetical protein